MQRNVVTLILTYAILFTPAFADASSKIFAWEVKGGKQPLYLVGSLHLATKSLYPLDLAFIEAFDRSDIVAVEVDTSNPEVNIAIQTVMMQKGLYPPGVTLRSKISPKTYEELKAFAEKRGIDITLLELMRPWAMALSMTQTELMSQGFSSSLGIDLFFLQKAKEEGKGVRELEDPLYQVELLTNWGDEDQEMFLKSIVSEMNRVEKTIDNLTNAWEKGDAKSFEKYALGGLKEEPKFRFIYKQMFADRNRAMTKKIKGYLKEDKAFFVVVGGGHLVGDDSIVALLEKAGYQVRQIDSAK